MEKEAEERGVMTSLVRGVVFVICCLSVLLPSLDALGQEHKGHMARDGAPMSEGAAETTTVFPPMPQPGAKVPFGTGLYLVYGFDKKPKLGTVIMKVEVFTADGKKDTSFEARADAGMPSMKGAHETGDRPFALSKKGDYLLPINIVMPGGWEVRLTLLKGGKVVFRGSHQFDV